MKEPGIKCLNCGQLAGPRFCPHCGQSVRSRRGPLLEVLSEEGPIVELPLRTDEHGVALLIARVETALQPMG